MQETQVDVSSIPGSGRSAGVENGNPLQCSCLENPRDGKKLEIELPYDPAIPLLGIHTEETRIERDKCTPMFTASPLSRRLTA